MEKFDIHILGCGSALPTLRHMPSAQLVNFREKLFMVDCGEGAQLQFRRSHQKFGRLGHIFLSHLHGDHCFGLIGLLSTLALAGRTAPLHVWGHAPLERLLRPWLDFFCRGAAYEVVLHTIPDDDAPHLLYEDRSLEIVSLPLHHRLPTTGFLFREKPGQPHIRRDMMDYLHIPLAKVAEIKDGADFVTPEGDRYPNANLVIPADPPRSYAYCSDTAYKPDLVPLLEGTDVLYHEATFDQSLRARAEETCHSTARQAATIARDAHVGSLLIGHYSSRYDDEAPLLSEAQAVFPGTIATHEGMVVHVRKGGAAVE